MFGLKLKNIFFILVGSAIFSFGVVHFNMQNDLGEGGFTGITLLLYFLFKWDPSITYLLLNIPVFFIGWKVLGRITFIYTLIGTFAVSGFLNLFQIKPFDINLESDMTLAALFAGAFLCWRWTRGHLPLWRNDRGASTSSRGSSINTSVGAWGRRCSSSTFSSSALPSSRISI